jgi:hypothetical protein
VDKGVDVHCSLDPSDVLSIGILKQQKVDIVCRYPDDQMLTARALNTFDIFTGEVLTPTLSSLSREKFAKGGRPHCQTTGGF